MSDLPLPALVSGPTYQVKVVFTDVLGLAKQAAVRMSGTTVGQVAGIETSNYTATVTLDLVESVEVPSNVRAEIRLPSPMGDSFIQLLPPKRGSSGRLAAGDTIDLKATSQAPSVGDLLSLASTVVSGGVFADIAVIVKEMNAMLDGNAGKIRGTLTRLTSMVTRLNQNTAKFDRALTSLRRFSADLARDSELLTDSLDAFTPAIDTLLNERQEILSLMSELRRLSRAASAVIEKSGPDIASVLRKLEPVLDTLSTNQENFHQILKGIDDFGAATDSATSGLFVNFDLIGVIDDDVWQQSKKQPRPNRPPRRKKGN